MLGWRNHPEVRAVCLTQHEITEEEHAAYWAATRAGGRPRVYIYERHGVPSGVVTYFDIDREAGSAWWGYYLDNDGLKERGELLPAWIEIQRQAKRLAFDELGLRPSRARSSRRTRPFAGSTVEMVSRRSSVTPTTSTAPRPRLRVRLPRPSTLTVCNCARPVAAGLRSHARTESTDEPSNPATSNDVPAIGGIPVGPDAPPFIIAEMSGNHDGSLDKALEIVRMAAKAGAHAIKLQTYTADTITIDVDKPEFRLSEGHELWGSRRLYELYEEAHTPWEWHQPIFDLARELGILAFSSPFDPTAVEFLEDLDVPGLQDRVVRDRRPAADPSGRPDRQAAHHLDRHGVRRRDRTRPSRPPTPRATVRSCCSPAP